MAEIRDNQQAPAHIVERPILKMDPKEAESPRKTESIFNLTRVDEQNQTETTSTGGLTGLARADDPHLRTLFRPLLIVSLVL